MAQQAPKAGDALSRRHPLQRMSSPSRGFSSLLHAFGLSSFGASFRYLVEAPSPASEAVGWHFQYLTIIGLSLATITFVFGSLADITLSRRLFAIKNALSVCSAPLEVLVSILYWGVRSIDRNLVIPPEYELPLLADIGFHLAPAVFLTLDLLFFSPPWTIAALPAATISGVIAVGYWCWIEYCYSYNGWYPYPLFEVLNPVSRGALFGFSAVLMTLSTIILRTLYGAINGYGVSQSIKARPRNLKA